MTYKATLSQSESRTKQDKRLSLADAINQHNLYEVASFHTPGHKGISPFAGAEQAWKFDVTELPGLDELADPSGLLKRLEESAAQLWSAQTSFISVNGASAALVAATLACSSRGKKILLPRNAHRSAIHALVLSGLEPVWYEPEFDSNWNIWTAVNPSTFEQALAKHGHDLACALVVSPTYGGQSSDVAALSDMAHRYNVPLIADEAHGAHRIADSAMPPSAVTLGADLVVHSLHKTLSALTQTGILHASKDSLIDANGVRAALNLLQSSSPSYLLMVSIERCLIDLLANPLQLARLKQLRTELDKQLSACTTLEIYSAEPTHLLVRPTTTSAANLDQYCRDRGIYCETILGNAVLFMMGMGTTPTNFEQLANALLEFAQQQESAAGLTNQQSAGTKAQLQRSGSLSALQTYGEQVLSPRVAFFSAVEDVRDDQAVGRIAAECIAPCPPGTPVVVPGQRLCESTLSLCGRPLYRVVVESSIQGEQ